MKYALANMLNGAGVRGLDPTAAAYINAVVATGASVSAGQRKAISNFVKAEKAASRWTSVKRLYFPIWGAASANAICMNSLSTGTFVGTVTHASGYVQGDGSTGYFNSSSTPSSLGLTLASGGGFFIISQADSRSDNRSFGGAIDDGAGNTAVEFTRRSDPSLAFTYAAGTARVTGSLATANGNGVLTYNRENGNRQIRRRNSAGATSIHSSVGANAGTIPTVRSFFFMGTNYVGALTGASNARFGVFGINSGYTNAEADAFSLNLKTLWETCTGSTIP